MKHRYQKANIEIASSQIFTSCEKSSIMKTLSTHFPSLKLDWTAPNGFLLSYDLEKLRELSSLGHNAKSSSEYNWKEEAKNIKAKIISESPCKAFARELSVEITLHSVSLASAE